MPEIVVMLVTMTCARPAFRRERAEKADRDAHDHTLDDVSTYGTKLTRAEISNVHYGHYL